METTRGGLRLLGETERRLSREARRAAGDHWLERHPGWGLAIIAALVLAAEPLASLAVWLLDW
jgi:hypothetical protein